MWITEWKRRAHEDAVSFYVRVLKEFNRDYSIVSCEKRRETGNAIYQATVVQGARLMGIDAGGFGPVRLVYMTPENTAAGETT